MDVIIQSLGFTASEDLKSFINEKLDKLINKEAIVRADVTLYLGPDSAASNNYCEIRLEMPGNDPFAKRNSDTLEKAVLDTIETLQKQLRRQKEKQIDRRQGAEPMS